MDGTRPNCGQMCVQLMGWEHWEVFLSLSVSQLPLFPDSSPDTAACQWWHSRSRASHSSFGILRRGRWRWHGPSALSVKWKYAHRSSERAEEGADAHGHGRVARVVYSIVQNYSCLFEYSRPSVARQLGQLMLGFDQNRIFHVRLVCDRNSLCAHASPFALPEVVKVHTICQIMFNKGGNCSFWPKYSVFWLL